MTMMILMVIVINSTDNSNIVIIIIITTIIIIITTINEITVLMVINVLIWPQEAVSEEPATAAADGPCDRLPTYLMIVNRLQI
jgi:hypothetical protein